jgi:tetratricopeptide (TPR) repeat protein
MRDAMVATAVRAVATLVCIGSVLLVPEAMAKPVKGVRVTEQDLRICMGFAGASPADQVPVCTKILQSGKVKSPHHADYHAYRAGAYLALKKSTAALDDLNKAIAVRDKPEFRFQRALVHMARGTMDDALVDLDVVVRQKADFAPAYFMRGAIAFRRKDFKLAEQEFDEAADRLPSYYQAIYARGVAKSRSGDASGGEADMKAARGMSSRVAEDLALMDIRP